MLNARSLIGRICLALAIVAAAAMAGFLAHPWLGDRAIFVPFTLSVLLATAWLGANMGAVAAFWAILAGIYFADTSQVTAGAFVEMAAFILTAVGIVLMAKVMTRSHARVPMELSIGETTEGAQRLFTGFIRDLTERQRIEERLESLQSELIHVSRVSAMGTMASTLAHELNQPITAVANYAEAVRDMLDHPERQQFPIMREALNETAREALRAGHIVRRLRDFVSRGEVEKTVEKLPQLINEAAVLGLMGAREKGIISRFDLDPYASPVLVDKVQIQQVIINLIRNAVEAITCCPGRQLTVTSRVEPAGFVKVVVADTGPGVTPAVAENLFTAFVSTKADGMGLGLSICRTIVEANGGRIWMQPATGGGAEFHFTLAPAEPEAGDE